MNLLSFTENQSDKITPGTTGIPHIIQMMHSHKHNQEKYVRNLKKKLQQDGGFPEFLKIKSVFDLS